MTLDHAREVLDRVTHELHVVEVKLRFRYPKLSIRFRVVRTLVGDLVHQIRRLSRSEVIDREKP